MELGNIRGRGPKVFEHNPWPMSRIRQWIRKRKADMKHIRYCGRRYAVVIRGHRLGLFDSRETAREARDEYLANL